MLLSVPTCHLCIVSPSPSAILCGPTPSLTLLCALEAILSALPKAGTILNFKSFMRQLSGAATCL